MSQLTKPKKIWLYEPGDRVFVRGWHQDHVATILDRIEIEGCFPRYLLENNLGDFHEVSQIELSSKRIRHRD